MVELFAEHGADHADVVRAVCQVRHVVGKLHAGLSVALKFARAGPNFGGWFDKGKAQVLAHRLWKRLSFPLLQLWFRIEQIDLAWGTFHEKEDDVPRAWRKMRCL